MKIELPVTENVDLRTYTFYSYLGAIIANDERVGETIAKVRISKYRDYEWKYVSKRLKVDVCGEEIVFCSSRYNIDLNGWIYRDLDMEDKFEIEITYQQYSQPWGNISIFVSEQDVEDLTTPLILKFGCINKVGHFYIEKNNGIVLINNGKGFGDRFCICKESNQLMLVEEKDTQKRIIHTFLLDDKKYKIGVAVNLYDNQYYSWLYSNHIVWKYNKNDRDYVMEFDSAIQRNWLYYTVNNFVVFRTEEIRILRKLKVDILGYIRCQLEENRYVEMLLDSYDINNTSYYAIKRFMHQCLIFGYDDEKQVINVMCTDGGKLVRGWLSYDCFTEQSKHFEDNMSIISQEYDPEKNVYEISLKLILDQLDRYIHSKPAINSDLLVAKEEYCYGYSVYDFLRQEPNATRLMKDIRISHLVYEHKKCMLERVEYLVAKELLEYEEVKEILSELEKEAKKALCLRELVLYYQNGKKGMGTQRVFRLLDNIANSEKEIYLRLIELIKGKVRII